MRSRLLTGGASSSALKIALLLRVCAERLKRRGGRLGLSSSCIDLNNDGTVNDLPREGNRRNHVEPWRRPTRIKLCIAFRRQFYNGRARDIQRNLGYESNR